MLKTLSLILNAFIDDIFKTTRRNSKQRSSHKNLLLQPDYIQISHIRAPHMHTPTRCIFYVFTTCKHIPATPPLNN